MTDETQVTPTLWAAIGRNVARLRDAAEIAQVDLAEAMVGCGVPWTGVTVAKVEKGRRDVTAGELVALGYCLDASVGDLLDVRGLVVLAKGDSRPVPAEAVTSWAKRERLRPMQIITLEREAVTAGHAFPWNEKPGIRRMRATYRRLGQIAAEAGQISQIAADAGQISAEVKAHLASWVAAEEAAGRAVTPHRRRGKEATLWAQEREARRSQ